MLVNIYNYRGTFNKDLLSAFPIGAHPYIPIFLIAGYYEDIDVELGTFVRLGYMPVLENASCYHRNNSIKHIREGFNLALTPVKIDMYDTYYIFYKGIVFNRHGKPLMMYCVKRESYISKIMKNDFQLKEEDYVMLYATEFMLDKSLAPLHKRLEKEFLTFCYLKGIEVRMMTSTQIEKNTFARVLEPIQSKSVIEIENFFSTVLPTVLYSNEEESFSVPELVVPVEELSIEEEALLYGAFEPVEEETTAVNNIFFDGSDFEYEEPQQEENSVTSEYPDWDTIEEEITARELENEITQAIAEIDAPMGEGLMLQIENMEPTYIVGADPALPNSSPVIWRSTSRRGQLSIELLDE